MAQEAVWIALQKAVNYRPGGDPRTAEQAGRNFLLSVRGGPPDTVRQCKSLTAPRARSGWAWHWLWMTSPAWHCKLSQKQRSRRGAGRLMAAVDGGSQTCVYACAM